LPKRSKSPTGSSDCSINEERIFSRPMRENHGNGWLTSTKPQVWTEEKNLWGGVLAVTAVNKRVEAWQECGPVPIRDINLTLCCNWLRGMHGSGHQGIIDKVILLIWFLNGLQQNLDTEWKFTRTKLWLNWIYKKGVLPPPFNILYVLLPVRWIIKRVLTMCIPAAILVSNAFLNDRIGWKHFYHNWNYVYRFISLTHCLQCVIYLTLVYDSNNFL